MRYVISATVGAVGGAFVGALYVSHRFMQGWGRW